jgi:hypothetical protein
MPSVHVRESYINALLDFSDNERRFQEVSQASLSQEKRAKFVLDAYEPALKALVVRPKSVKMMKINNIDELVIFCSALKIGWKLWPVFYYL